jgi:hypothetical protein
VLDGAFGVQWQDAAAAGLPNKELGIGALVNEMLIGSGVLVLSC